MPSVQVGAFCYATPVAAAGAVCAAHVPSTVVVGGNVVQLSCAGVTPSGAVLMRTSVAPVDASASAVVSTLELSPSFAPCVWDDYAFAFEAVVSAVLLAWIGWYGVKKINDFLRSGRGSHE